jgi:hypothetical protein
VEGDLTAIRLLRQSSEISGDPWQKLRQVEVDYDGEWSGFAQRTQPVLVDAGFRKSSTEIYTPGRNSVSQLHRGPAGEKRVQRSPGNLEIWRNGEVSRGTEERRAAALVADAYTLFTFGSSVLKERGTSWRLLGRRMLHGESCQLIAGTLRPGLGESSADGVIAWIGLETKRLLRLQFTLNGLESTAGADVDVTFNDFQPGPYGTEWPRHFLERVRRPLDVKAHEWKMTNLTIVP